MNIQKLHTHLGNELSKRLKGMRVRIMSVVRGWRLRLMGVKVGRRVVFGGPVNTRFNGNPRCVEIHDDVVFFGRLDLRNRENGAIVIGRGCSFDDGLRLVAARESTISFSEGCSAGIQLIINAGGNVQIGKNCIFSSYVHISGSAHPIYREKPIVDQGYVQGWVEIGEDCWLANCTNILMNTRIGKGAIISANTMVGGTIPEFAILAGSPARKIGERPFRDADLAKPVDDSKCEDAEDLLPPQKVLTPIKCHLDLSDVLEACQTAFRCITTGNSLPADDAPLRAGGELDSLMWFEFLTALEGELGIRIPVELSSQVDFDSFKKIAMDLSGNSNTTDWKLPTPSWTVFQQFQSLVKMNPSAIAIHVKNEGGEFQSFTRGELMESANRFAAYLLDCGVKVGDRVGIVYPTSQTLIAAHLGCLQIGAIPSLHPYPSPKVKPDVYAQNNIAVFLRLRLRWLYCQKKLAVDLKPLLGEVTTCLYGDNLDQVDPEKSAHQPALEDVAIIQHSSGTTGVQKGVALCHQAISRQIADYSASCELKANDCIISWLPLYHDMGFIACYLTSVTTGVPLCLFSPFDWIAQPQLFWQAAKRYNGSIAWMPNFAFNVLCRATPKSEQLDPGTLRIRALINCSESVSAQTMRAFSEHFEALGLGPDKLWSCYAMAENTFAVTQSKGFRTIAIDPEKYASDNRVVLSDGGLEIVTQGPPVASSQIRITDDHGKELKDLKVGEIRLQSPCMLTEYFDNRLSTAETLVDGWCCTGDLGFLYDGELYVSGRKKDLIIIGGRNFYPQDIEAIANRIPGIKPGRSCAFGVYNNRVGTESLVVLGEQNPEHSIEEAQITRELKRAVLDQLDCVLTDFRMLDPGSLIKTTSGKISRGACEKMYTERLLSLE